MFGTSGIRGPVGETVTADLGLAIGRSLGTEGYGRVVVGRDVRGSGDLLADAVVAGLRECGADVTRLGVASTPTIARAVGWYGADAGVAVTASHNPPADNGFKLWLPSGRSFGEAEQERIVERLTAGEFDLRSADGLGDVTTDADATRRHVEAIVEGVGDVAPLDVVIDVGNGTGGVTVEALQTLGCAVTTLNAQPDGRFPGRASEPTAENCRDLMTLTRESDADLGIAHDGDADRMVAVAPDGTFLPGDVLLALFAREAAESGDAVASPVDTSLLVEDTLRESGVSVRYTRVGDGFVAEAATAPNVVFGGEPSGAWIWPDATLCPDGPLAAAKLVELVSVRGDLTNLMDEIERYPLRRESFPAEDRERVMARLDRDVHEVYESVDDRDGLRVDLTDGWFLIRPSGTEPLIRVTAEARSEGRMEELLAEACAIVEEGRSSQ